MYTSMHSSVSSTLVTVWAFKRNCFLIKVSMSTSVRSFRVPWSETTKVNRCAVLFKPLSTRNSKHSKTFRWHYTFRIGANRSFYEEVLVVRVHPEILRSQGLSEELRDEKTIWDQRYRSIVDLESHLYRNGTRTVKVFLHLSPEEQRKRFLERIDDPDKNWKFGLADMYERKYWKHYMKAYEACLNATSTHHAPWYVVPADDKENARLIVSQVVLDSLHELKMAYPRTTAKRRLELDSIRKLLTK